MKSAPLQDTQIPLHEVIPLHAVAATNQVPLIDQDHKGREVLQELAPLVLLVEVILHAEISVVDPLMNREDLQVLEPLVLLLVLQDNFHLRNPHERMAKNLQENQDLKITQT